jgi:hypothetical protein
MEPRLIPRSLGRSISFRASLVAELATKLAEQDKLDKEMRELMLQKAPEELRKWLDEDMVLTNLFRYGRCDAKIRFGDEYGFKNLEDTKAKMKILGNAWKDVVRIRLGTPEQYRVEVYLAAVM